jgi:hypothetical protein
MCNTSWLLRLIGLMAAVPALAGCAAAGKPAMLRVEMDETHVLIHRQPPAEPPIVARYRHADVPFKPYVDHLASPAGVNVLRDAPHDHLHHHGLMFAVRVDDVGFWAETPESGHQIQRDLSNVRVQKQAGSQKATLTQRLDWTTPDRSRVMLHEERTVTVHAGPGLAATLLTWRSELSLPEDVASAVLGGSEYYGLGIRFVPSMDEVGELFNASGGTGVGGTNGSRALWCAYTAEANGHPVTVALFDHPENVRHPATWFTMTTPFAYISATLRLHQETLTLQQGRPLALHYGVAVWDGRAEPAAIERVHRRWVELIPSERQSQEQQP